MGTPCEIFLYGPQDSGLQRVSKAIIDDVSRLENRYSRYREDSLLSDINRAAANGAAIGVDAETASLLDYADTCFQQSGGLFDITSGILRKAWDFKSGAIPSSDSIARLLDRIGWQRVEWQSPQLAFPHQGMELDLGGIVKEYAVDRAATICLEAGLQHGMINLGGDIRIIGPHPDGSPWRVAVSDPAAKREALRILEISSGALASSGDYERCITIDGVRYGHILNPHTGWPVKQLAAVSIAADICVVAGSAATIGMLKEEQGKAWLENLGLPYLWVDVQGNSAGPLLS